MKKIAADKNYRLTKRAEPSFTFDGPGGDLSALNSWLQEQGVISSELDAKTLEAFQSLWAMKAATADGAQRVENMLADCIQQTGYHF
tara:strand:+ start:1701 stop:1961 length:261 start_codon:yes stop_codon:yes gene_type:complete